MNQCFLALVLVIFIMNMQMLYILGRYLKPKPNKFALRKNPFFGEYLEELVLKLEWAVHDTNSIAKNKNEDDFVKSYDKVQELFKELYGVIKGIEDTNNYNIKP